ncbi:uncharacterized protein BDR25DRAFT_90245 [Lindgomyces ingoldianus]|uniref:Uncharacterized protein n=1 Tax=Lindgomyces ingoldianus TaxID=673940 RepID=A0ACB6RA98_9PLEO|nr:uncharacterized protein BDR25DRAFT_90245 [Lindgomyces ingoldianus]KAF2476066.1 hypothetical protein BDR25DRAFT_90245 [Lindgomyces ingoldianus]
MIPPLAVRAAGAVPPGTAACPYKPCSSVWGNLAFNLFAVPLLLLSMRGALLQRLLQRISRLRSSFS